MCFGGDWTPLGAPNRGSAISAVGVRRKKMALSVGVKSPHPARRGRPDIFNTDQRSEFTGAAFTGGLASHSSRSAWTAKAPGGTTSSSSAFGGR